MRIKILGTQGEIKESTSHHSYKSGVLIDNKILGDYEFLSYNAAKLYFANYLTTKSFSK